jgi:hypothetical protein
MANVTVTISNPLTAAQAASLGMPGVAVNPGDVVTLPDTVAAHLVSIGYASLGVPSGYPIPPPTPRVTLDEAIMTNSVSTTSTAGIPIPGFEVSSLFDGVTPARLILDCMLSNSVAGVLGYVFIQENGSNIAVASTTLGPANQISSCHREVSLTGSERMPSAGYHTYTTVLVVATGTGTIYNAFVEQSILRLETA